MKPKFKIGDIVEFHDSFSNNPATETLKICKVDAIMITKKECMGHKIGVRYILSAHSTVAHEKDLTLYTGGKQ